MTSMTRLQDAYPPNDGTTYEMVKIVANDTGFDPLACMNYIKQTTETLRVESAMLAEDEEYRGKSEFTFAQDKADAFKQQMQAVVTDALDENGQHLPGRRVTYKNVEADGSFTNYASAEFYIKNGKAHTVQLENGQRLVAVTSHQSNGRTVLCDMQDGKPVDRPVPGRGVIPSKIVLAVNGNPLWGEYAAKDGMQAKREDYSSNPGSQLQMAELLKLVKPQQDESFRKSAVVIKLGQHHKYGGTAMSLGYTG